SDLRHRPRRGSRDRFLHARHLVLDRLPLVVVVISDTRWHIRLVAQRISLVADARACLFYFRADVARVFAHSTSSFTVSMVCSGSGEPASSTRSLPCLASTYAAPARTPPTISADSHSTRTYHS